MNAPEVSVVMGVCNGADYLEQTLVSILSQEGCDFEFVVVNDGSTDDTGHILDQWAVRDRRLRVIHQQNAGLTRALIAGCAAARGPYVARQDAGDVSLPRRLALQANALRQDMELAFVSCKTRYVEAEGEYLFSQEGTGLAGFPINIIDMQQSHGIIDGPSSHPSVMFRRDRYLEVGGYREQFYFAQDWDLWYRLGMVGKFQMLPFPLYQARMGVGDISTSSKHSQEELAVLSLHSLKLRLAGKSDAEVLDKASRIRPKGNRNISRGNISRGSYFLGECLRRNGDVLKARSYFLQSIKNQPLNFKAWVRLAQVSFARSRRDYMNNLRSTIAAICRHTPMFKGKGRLVLLLDRILTRADVLSSYSVVGSINGLAEMNFDLRPWGQKFAYYYGEWERDYIELTRKLYPGGAFVDVGSSLGLYVVCLGDLVKKAGSIIVSVEPVAFNLEKQKNNVSLNQFDDVVEYFPIALGEMESILRISADPNECDNNAYVSSDGGIEISVTTLDRLLVQAGIGRVGFIKMDVEGFEPMVIAGGQEIICRDHPVIFSEFNRERMEINGFDIASSWQFLLSEGYRAYQVSKGKLQLLVEPGDVENVFFLPSTVAAPSSCFS